VEQGKEDSGGIKTNKIKDDVKIKAYVAKVQNINHDEELSPQDQRELTHKYLVKLWNEATISARAHIIRKGQHDLEKQE
jgi:hypothetical protein